MKYAVQLIYKYNIKKNVLDQINSKEYKFIYWTNLVLLLNELL